MRAPFARGLGVVLLGEAVSGVSALVYTMVTARILGTAEYGLFQSVMAIYSMLTAFTGPFSLAVVHCVATSGGPVRRSVVGALIRASCWMGGIGGAVVIVLAPWLVRVLHSDVYPLVWVAVLAAATAVVSTCYATWQAYGAYSLYAAARALDSLVRLAVGSVLVAIGTKSGGAVLGYAFGVAAVLILFFSQRQLYSWHKSSFDFRGEFATFTDIVLAYGTISLVSDLPVVLARSRLSANVSGLYGALHGLRNLVLPFCYAVALSLYSRTVATSDQHVALRQALVPVLGLGAAFLGVSLLFPQLPLQMIYGSAYVGASAYMALYGIALLLQMICIIVMFYQIARGAFGARHLLVPSGVLVGGATLLGTTVGGLIVAQIAAWTLYLALCVLRLGKAVRRRQA